MTVLTTEELARWTPIRLSLDAPEPMVDWCDLSGVPFEEPFFQQTVGRWTGGDTPRPVVRTDLQGLAAVDALGDCLEPAGFIFHMSRCGSTLLSRLLGTVPGTLVLSEAEPVNTLLETDPDLYDEQSIVTCLRLLVRAYGRRRLGTEQRFIVKLSSWNIRRLPLLRAAFPNTPWIWVYRTPVEVMASALKGRPGWLQLHRYPAFAERLLGIPADEVSGLSEIEFCARALAGFCAAAYVGDDGSAALVNYRELPDAVWTRVAPFLGVALTESDIERMREEAGFYAKDTGRTPFVPDLAAVDPAVEAASATWIDGLYQMLEERRTGA